MTGTVPKSFREVLNSLNGHNKVAVIGCDLCAKACKSGGSEQVDEMSEKLKGKGKEAVFSISLKGACNLEKTKSALEEHLGELNQAEVAVVLGCGGGVQIVRQVIDKECNLRIPVRAGLDTVGHMDTLIMFELAKEQCQNCGECILNETGGICPVTKCAKSLLNGPCGGSQNGKCEVDSERDCAWISIYNRMTAIGELFKLNKFMEPKDYAKMANPRKLYIKERRVA